MHAIQGCLLRAFEEGGRAAMVVVLAMTTLVQGQQAAAVRTVDRVDLDRYIGEWFEIARLANDFQTRCVSDVRAIYARRGDGRIDVTNRCRMADGKMSEAKGVARVVDTRTAAQLKVRFAPALLSFLPFVWGDYWILGLGDDYSWAVVGSPDRNYLWILSRTPRLDQASYTSALDAARRNGFAVDRLIKATHTESSLTAPAPLKPQAVMS